ncbi:hypothetical protein GCM10027088_40250 [Nocardia goodfellowii]
MLAHRDGAFDERVAQRGAIGVAGAPGFEVVPADRFCVGHVGLRSSGGRACGSCAIYRVGVLSGALRLAPTGCTVLRRFRRGFVSYAATKRKRNSPEVVGGKANSLTADNVHLSGVRTTRFSEGLLWGDTVFVSYKYVVSDETNATIQRCPAYATIPDVSDPSRAAADPAAPRNTVTIQTTRDGVRGGNVNGCNRSRRYPTLPSL